MKGFSAAPWIVVFSKKDCTYKLGDFGLAACVMPDQAKLIVDELLEVEMI